MKKMVVVFALLIAAFSAHADEMVLGERITLKKVTKISELIENRDKYQGKTVLVEGTIIDVCSARGCWMALAGDKPFQSITVSVQDGVIVFPLHAKGRTGMAEGVFDAYDLNMEETIEHFAHKAEEKGVKFDPSKVKKPITEFTIFATGAVIK